MYSHPPPSSCLSSDRKRMWLARPLKLYWERRKNTYSPIRVRGACVFVSSYFVYLSIQLTHYFVFFSFCLTSSPLILSSLSRPFPPIGHPLPPPTLAARMKLALKGKGAAMYPQPEMHLGEAMIKGGSDLGEDSSFGEHVTSPCGHHLNVMWLFR